MSFPSEFPAWMFLYFAAFGTLALILVALIGRTWMQAMRLTTGALRRVLVWHAVGTVFLFSATWFACGVGAGPGNLLSLDASIQRPFLAGAAAVAGMFCSVLGWACLLMGMRRIVRGIEEGEIASGGR
jgi:threonine/homoserine/homoserine lactone efflux protein